MAIPSTGALGLKVCPGGVPCSSISGVVCGGTTGTISLLDMGAKIGMTGTIYMSNFHGSILGDLYVCPATIANISASGQVVNTYAWSVTPNTFSVLDNCTWITPAAPEPPSTTYPGSEQGITVAANTGAARSGVVCYVPSHCGTTQYVTLCQLAGASKYVNFTCISCTGLNTTVARACSSIDASPAMVSGEYYCACYCTYLYNSIDYGMTASFCIGYGTTTLCTYSALNGEACCCCFSLRHNFGEAVCITTCARRSATGAACRNEAWVCLYDMKAGGCTNILKGTTRTFQWSYTCGSAPQ